MRSDKYFMVKNQLKELKKLTIKLNLFGRNATKYENVYKFTYVNNLSTRIRSHSLDLNEKIVDKLLRQN